MAHLLVIGGSGFFGKSILDSFNKGFLKSFDVTKISILARNADILKTHAPHLLSRSVSLINSDIGHCSELPIADYVIHAAASTDEKNYLAQAAIERRNILAGTYNFCKLAKTYCLGSKVIFVSSGAVYGQQPSDLIGLKEEAPLVSIDTLPIVKQDYALAKRDSERAIQDLGASGVSVSIARCFAFIGAYLPRDRSFAIGNFIEDGIFGRPISVNARKLVVRSYLEANDLVNWLLLICRFASPSCPIFNVGSDEEITVQDLAIQVANYFNVSAVIPPIDSNHVDRYIPSIEMAKAIGCTINLPLDEAIRRTILSVIGQENK